MKRKEMVEPGKLRAAEVDALVKEYAGTWERRPDGSFVRVDRARSEGAP